MTKTKHPIFGKALGGFGLCIVLSVYLFLRATKDKSSFKTISGPVTHFSNKFPSAYHSNSDKHRYLQIEGYPKTFELFIGKKGGDFKPRFENIDVLKIGDTIIVFYDENTYTDNDNINRLVYFIDRRKELIFIKGSWEKGGVYFGLVSL